MEPTTTITNGAQWQDGKPVALTGVRRPEVESVFLYYPETEWAYSHHASITFFRDRLYTIWSNGRQDEDAPGQRVLIPRPQTSRTGPNHARSSIR